MTRLYYCCVIAIFTLIRAGRKNLFCLLTTVDVFQVLLAVERRIRRYRKAQDRSNSGVNTVKWLSWEMAWGKLPKMSRAKHRCECYFSLPLVNSKEHLKPILVLKCDIFPSEMQSGTLFYWVETDWIIVLWAECEHDKYILGFECAPKWLNRQKISYPNMGEHRILDQCIRS